MKTCYSREVSLRGLTLLELVIALGLLAAISLGLLALFVASRTTSGVSEAKLAALALSESELMKAKSRPYRDLVDSLVAPLPSYTVLQGSVSYDISSDGPPPRSRLR